MVTKKKAEPTQQEQVQAVMTGVAATVKAMDAMGVFADNAARAADAIVAAAQGNETLMAQVMASHEIEREEESQTLRILRAARGTLADQENELQKLISAYVKTFGTRVTGKTNRHRNNGYFSRKTARRSEHEGWMHRVAQQPNSQYPHPFHTKAA